MREVLGIQGPRKEFYLHSDGSSITINKFEEPEPVSALLHDGSIIELPFVIYKEKSIAKKKFYQRRSSMQHDAPGLRAIYDNLPDVAKHAVNIAVDNADHPVAKTQPYYKRLALLRDPKSGSDSLYTVNFKPNLRRSMTQYPGPPPEPGLDVEENLDRDLEQAIEYPVSRADHVMDSYLVLPDDGGYLSRAMYDDSDPNLFGPGPDQANTFWISGTPRRVLSKNYQKVMRLDPRSGASVSAFIIVPVQYYKVTEVQEM